MAQRLVASNQSAFIKGRYILESVVVAHEVVHSLHKNKEKGVILKLDYEKAYDRVSWKFLFEVVESRGFSAKWISWIIQIVMGGSVGIMVNGRDPISPLLFNIVGDALSRMLARASERGLIRGVLNNFKEGHSIPVVCR